MYQLHGEAYVRLPDNDPRLTVQSDVPGGIWFLGCGTAALFSACSSGIGPFAPAQRPWRLPIRCSSVWVSGFFVASYHPAWGLEVQALLDPVCPVDCTDRLGNGLHHGLETPCVASVSGDGLAQVAAGAALVAGPTIALSAAASESPGLAPNGGAPT